MARVFIIHGWEGYPEEGWFPWLKRELEQKGFNVFVPALPNPHKPRIDSWVAFLKKQVKNSYKETFFVGHSIGCQAILRYVESMPNNTKIGGAVFVAGWFNLMSLESEEEKKIAKPWLEIPINYNKVKKHLDKIIAVFSDNDPFVSSDNSKIFKEKLGAEIITEHNKGHFSGSDNVKELPSVLKALLKISK